MVNGVPVNQFVDAYDQCMEIADHTEAILAYYYKDENGQLKTTEIFKLDEPEMKGAPPSPAELVSALAAKKLMQHGSTRSVISAEGFDDSDEGMHIDDSG